MVFICFREGSHLYLSHGTNGSALTAQLHHGCRAGAVGVQHLELFCGPALGHGQVGCSESPSSVSVPLGTEGDVAL